MWDSLSPPRPNTAAVPLSARALEAGLAILVVAAPLPFGAVPPGGRIAVEAAALVLTAAWTWTALRRPVPLPPASAALGLAGLLALAAVQLVPWSGAPLSVAPASTASALLTGAALAGTILVGTSVAAWRGGRVLAAALLGAAAFQGLHGLLVLASGHEAIWGVPKTDYLDSATGTFINRNHYAAFIAGSLPPGLGLALAAAKRARAGAKGRSGLLVALSNEGTRAFLLALAALLALAGLLLSFSRAGTALGLVAVAATAVVVLRARPVRGAALVALFVAVAAVPLLDLGADRLTARYASSSVDLSATGGRADVWRDTLAMVRARPLAGFGFGAFAWAFPSFRSPEVRLHYSHAHEDLLQLAAEGGALALLLLASIAVPLARCATRILARNDDPTAVGAVFGLGAILLHSLVDFPFHIPADALLACVLAGIVFGASWTGRR
jgi:O-antigen ligase